MGWQIWEFVQELSYLTVLQVTIATYKHGQRLLKISMVMMMIPCWNQHMEGAATAGLLALAGLDGIFNLGASMFLLMTDSCARSWRWFLKKGDHPRYELPPGYKGWTLFVNIIGLLGPLVAYLASKRGFLGAEPALLPMSAMILPYLCLLLVHTCTELLVWKWQSPVWPILPLVYDCYSVLQLSRGLQLGQALGAPMWTIEAVKGLISWWVLVLAVQFMWIAWFVGSSQK